MAIMRRKNGTYQIQVFYRTPDGSRARISADRKTMKEAKDCEAMLRLKSQGNNVDPSSFTFGDVTREFLEKTKSGYDFCSTSWNNLEKICRLHLVPFFGKTVFSQISINTIEDWEEKMRSKVSSRTNKVYAIAYLQKIFSILQDVFHYAFKIHGVRNDSLERVGNFKSNPDDVPEEIKLNYWTLPEFLSFSMKAKEFLYTLDPMNQSYLQNWACYTEICILFFAGLRRGEANALKVSDFIDVGYPYLHVNKSLTEKIKGKKYFVKSPKTKNSIRNVPIPSDLVDIIRDHIDNRISRLSGFNEDMFLCGGLFPIADTTLDNFLHRFQKEACLKYVKVHQLRHSYVSMLINAGVDANRVSHLAGHASVAFTLRVYGHLYPTTQDEAVSAMDRMIKNSSFKICTSNSLHVK